MEIEVLVGDVLDVPANVLISTANPWLQMTGGVNLKIILRPQGEFVHEELQRHLQGTGRRYVEPGTVVRTGPGSLPVEYILHAVSIDPSYDSSVGLVADTIEKALTQARELDARTVTMPALATGFGPLSMEDFALALSRATARDWSPLRVLKVVVLQEADAERVRAVLARSRGQITDKEIVPGTSSPPATSGSVVSLSGPRYAKRTVSAELWHSSSRPPPHLGPPNRSRPHATAR